MKYYRLNQIAMAVLGALLLFFGARTLINIAYEEHPKEGYEVAGTEEEGKGEEKPDAGSQLATLLAGADPARGADVFKKCAICHSVDKGGPNMIGPNLYGVLGHKIASHEGYEYSAALKAKEGDWNFENLDHMIENPNAFAPGTKMALFPGLPDAKQRADVIAFLRNKNDNPPPLPEATAEKPAAEEKPAEEKPAEGAEVLGLLATADPKQGQTDAALCKVCHSFEKGGPNLIGPDLYDIVGRKIASVDGFNYSPALKAHAGEVWGYENLDPWLKNPQALAPGTTMAFAGVPDAKKRANIIAFLRSLSDNPAPLPAAAAPAEVTTEPAEAKPDAPAPEPEALPEEPEAPATEPEAPAAEPEAPAGEPEAPAAEPEAAIEEPEVVPPEMEKVIEETEDDPSTAWEPSVGEPPFANQPQPVYPDDASTDEPAAGETAAEAEPASMGEGPFANQPQPVYPDDASTDEPAASETAAEDEPASMGEGPFANQPQPVYPDGPSEEDE
jgi:cytochrome c2